MRLGFVCRSRVSSPSPLTTAPGQILFKTNKNDKEKRAAPNDTSEPLGSYILGSQSLINSQRSAFAAPGQPSCVPPARPCPQSAGAPSPDDLLLHPPTPPP